MKYSRNAKGGLVNQKKRFVPDLHARYKHGEPVKIQFGYSKCQFLTPYPKEVYEALSVLVPGHFFIPSVKAGFWDGKHRFITKPGYFATGLLPVVVSLLTRGVNPLDKSGDKVLHKPVANFTLIVPEKCVKRYYPGLENYYENNLDMLQYFSPETGEFSYPFELLKAWFLVKDTNPLAGKVLKLAKSLRSK